jgi:hypothetical protein
VNLMNVILTGSSSTSQGGFTENMYESLHKIKMKLFLLGLKNMVLNGKKRADMTLSRTRNQVAIKIRYINTEFSFFGPLFLITIMFCLLTFSLCLYSLSFCIHVQISTH